MPEPENLKVEELSKSVKQAPHSEQATGHGMHCREMLFTPRCSPRAREFPRSNQLFCTTYGCGATGYQNCPIFRFWPIFPIQNAKNVPSGDQPAAHGLHRRMIPIFLCDRRRSKGVPSGSGVSLRLLVGELGTPKLAQIFAYSRWLYPYRVQLHCASDLNQSCLKTRNSMDGCTFPPNVFTRTPKTPFCGTFQCKTYYTE